MTAPAMERVRREYEWYGLRVDSVPERWKWGAVPTKANGEMGFDGTLEVAQSGTLSFRGVSLAVAEAWCEQELNAPLEVAHRA